MDEGIRKKIASRLKAARKAAGYRTAREFADKNGIPRPTYTTHETGSRGMYPETLQKYAKLLNRPPAWFYEDQPEKGASAESFTENELLTIAPNSSSLQNVEYVSPIQGEIPLISWVQAGEWCNVMHVFVADDVEEWLPSPPKKLSKHAYALRVRGESMSPRYTPGDIIYVDPEIEPHHGSLVVVRLDDSGETTFKELIIEGSEKYLRALNENWPNRIMKVSENATICGVVKGSYREVP